MEPLTKLGETFSTLRDMLGASVEEAAAKAGLSPDEFRAAEKGIVPPNVRERLAKLFSLDLEQLEQGLAVPSDDPLGDVASIFLFHNGTQDFRPTDWRVLSGAMRWARLYVTRNRIGREGLKCRLQFTPTPVAGPEPRHAALQGYGLARQVRTQLDLRGKPLKDIRSLVENRLGIVVLVNEFSTTDLRAASILDVQRVGAAASLSATDRERTKNPNLARVYLAHEVCHLLFDSGQPGCVQIALDNQPGQALSKASLLESRARAFAAEFLLPEQGLNELLGEPARIDSFREASRLVKRAAGTFGTPWEIAARHLGNLGFISLGMAGELVQEGPEGSIRTARTDLPKKGQRPLCLSRTTLPRVAGDGAPALASESRELAHNQRAALADQLLGEAYKLLEEKPRAATDLLMERLDALLSGNELDQVRAILERLDPNITPPMVLTPLLSLTWHARQPLGGARDKFFNRAMAALGAKWQLPADRLNSLRQRLQ